MPAPAVSVIGAGPAGSLAATLLARGGFDVTLIEQSRFPRDKVCGECLSDLAIQVLSRHGLAGRVLSLGAVRLGRAKLVAADGLVATIDLPRPMYGLSRQAMDLSLRDIAREAGASISQPTRCDAIEPAGQGVTLRLRDVEANATKTAPADWAIVADGKGALGEVRPSPTGDFGVKAHFADVDSPADLITIFAARGHYGGLAPIEGGRWNVAMNVPGSRIRSSAGDLDALFEDILSENPEIRRQLARARRITPWLSCPLPRFAPSGDWPARVIPVGNAAAALEPIGGEGMGLALRSAELAVAEIHGSERSQLPPDTARLLSQYRHLWQSRRLACRTVARAVSSPRFGSLAVAAAASSESLARAAMWMMGK